MSDAGPVTADAWMGLDLGTQSVRALVVSDGGAVLGSGSQPLTSRRDGNRHEQSPKQWWEAVCAASRQAMSTVPQGSVRGLAVDATSGTILLVDAAGDAMGPALMYDDTRAVGEVDRVNAAGSRLWEQLGYQRMQASWALPKVMWLMRSGATAVDGARLAHQGDFVNRRLVGAAVATDLSNALKTGANLIDEVWPEDVFDELGMPPALLPPLVRSGTVIGAVCGAAAELTGIPAGTPVVAGSTDGCAAQLGSGALSVGSWNSVLGTTLVVKGVTKELVRDPLGAVYSHRAPTGDWLPGGASSTGAGAVSRDFAGHDLAALERRARDAETTQVVTYPLVSRGERFPFVAPEAVGFTLGTPRDDAEQYASVLQGVAFLERLCFDHLDHLGAPVDGSLILTGGATRSAYWCQLRADILGRPVCLPDNAEPALGMALLAASTTRPITEAAGDMVRLREVIDPRPGTVGRFDDSYVRLVDELEHRGWLAPAAAAHARAKTP